MVGFFESSYKVFKILFLDAQKDGLIWRKELDIKYYKNPYCKGADIVGQIFNEDYFEILMGT